MKKNDFGYKQINKKEHYDLIQNIFTNVASNYDLMNDLMSLGLHRSWKKEFISMIDIANKDNLSFVDLAGGTGDIAEKLSDKYPNSTIRIIDKNIDMINGGINKINSLKKIQFICGDGENIPISDNSTDLVTVSFGIRNMTDRNKCLKECYRILKPNGIFLCMEFSMPENYTLRNLYDAWSFLVIPKLGKLINKSEKSYQYLVESIRTFPRPKEFVKILKQNNFNKTSIRQLSGNIVCIYKCRKS